MRILMSIGLVVTELWCHKINMNTTEKHIIRSILKDLFLIFRPRKLKKTKLRKASPKSLQQEDSDAVWNELAYYKKHHKNLTIDKSVFLSPPVDHARWAHMHRFLSVRLSVCDND